MLNLNSLLTRAAEIGGSEVAVTDAYYSLSWRAFEARCERSSGFLSAQGLRAGDRVAVLMSNSVRLLELIFAITRLGAVVVPVNTRFAGPEIIDCLTDCGAHILIVQPELWERIAAQNIKATEVKTIIACGLGEAEEEVLAPEVLSYHNLFAQAPAILPSSCGGEDPAAIFYTSGTTGRAKGVTLTHAGIIINELQWIAALGLDRHDKLLVVAPMFHAAGALNAIGTAALGCGVHFMANFDLDTMLSIISEHKITKIGLIVVMLEMISRHPSLSNFDLSSVKKISYGGSPISDKALELARKSFPNAALFQVYGQTEGGPTVSILPSECHISGSARIRSAGLPVIGTEVVILDEQGEVLPIGEIGEICVAGPGVSPGYWGSPDETAKSRAGRYLRTGDAGYKDADGYLYISDRVKDMIISGGENVYSSEVENALMKYDDVVECAVIGIPSEKWGEQVHAILRLQEGAELSEDKIIAHCRELLAGYKIPRSVEFRAEPLPLSPSAKILKTELRAPYWAGKEKKI